MNTAPQNGQIVLLKNAQAYDKKGKHVGYFGIVYARWLPFCDGMAWVSKQVHPYGNLEFRNPENWKRGTQGRGKYADWGEANEATT